jgi:hypothetical protein
MLAIGCLIPLLLAAAGGAIGVAIGSTAAGFWGGLAGFAVGCIGLIAFFVVLEARGKPLGEPDRRTT